MLRLIVEAAIHWMQIGLPIKELKIVLFQNKTESINETNQILVDYFDSLKQQNLETTLQRVITSSTNFSATVDTKLNFGSSAKVSSCEMQIFCVCFQSVRFLSQKFLTLKYLDNIFDLYM